MLRIRTCLPAASVFNSVQRSELQQQRIQFRGYQQHAGRRRWRVLFSLHSRSLYFDGHVGWDLSSVARAAPGIWQFNLVITPDFQISIPNPTLTVFAGETALLEGTASALNGY